MRAHCAVDYRLVEWPAGFHSLNRRFSAFMICNSIIVPALSLSSLAHLVSTVSHGKLHERWGRLLHCTLNNPTNKRAKKPGPAHSC